MQFKKNVVPCWRLSLPDVHVLFAIGRVTVTLLMPRVTIKNVPVEILRSALRMIESLE